MKSGIKLFLLMILSVSAGAQYIPKFDLQGHRGARGLKPENTIPAFLTALNYGVTTLEMDVVITKDKQVLVSHEPWMSADNCLKPDGTLITKSEEKGYNIYQMNYNEITKFDCGSKANERFPEQEKAAVQKPLLIDVIAAVEDHIKSFSTYEVDYNIEIKSAKAGDNKFHPAPEVYSDLVYQVVSQYLPLERVVIQSFDFRILKYWKKKYPAVRLAALVENTRSVEANLDEIGFLPSIYSPYFKLINKQDITDLQKKKIRVIPWTVNETEDMSRLKSWGVDGIITDYPNRAAALGLSLKRTETGANRK